MASSYSLGNSPRLGSVRLTPDLGLGVQSWELCDSLLKALVVLGGAFVRRPVQLAGLVPVGWCPGRSAGRISACGSWLLYGQAKGLSPCEIACGLATEHVVVYYRDTPFWNAVFETECQEVTWVLCSVVVCMETLLIDRVPPQHSELGKWLQEGIGYF